MDPTTLAGSVTAALVPALPFLVKGGEKLAEMAAQQLGTAAMERAKALWERVRGPLQASPAAAEAVRDLAEHPGDADTQAALRRQIKKALEADAELLQGLAALMEQAGHRAALQGDPQALSLGPT